MPKGGQLVIETRNVEISEDYCRLAPYALPGDYVLLSVSDTGIGMDADTIEQVFEPFFTTKEMGKGTGLGLATVYGIVKQHGGFLNVKSEPGKGATFQIYLPASSGLAEPREAKGNEEPRKGTETILLAEDHDGLRQSAEEMLEALGYRVLLAETVWTQSNFSRQIRTEWIWLFWMPSCQDCLVRKHFRKWPLFEQI